MNPSAAAVVIGSYALIAWFAWLAQQPSRELTSMLTDGKLRTYAAKPRPVAPPAETTTELEPSA